VFLWRQWRLPSAVFPSKRRTGFVLLRVLGWHLYKPWPQARRSTYTIYINRVYVPPAYLDFC
jgi:hypothetical protein